MEVFCNSCSALVPFTDEDSLACICCGRITTMKDVGTFEVVMKSKAKPPQSWLATIKTKPGGGKDANGTSQRDDQQQQQRGGSSSSSSTEPREESSAPLVTDDRATVKETCPKCHHPEAKFHTQQTRSADEGQTCFYTCIKCKNVWTQDN